MSEEKYLTLYKEQPWDIRKTYGYVFHAKARERVTELLRAIAKRGDIDRNLDIGRCRRHDAIFVNGGRGVGKTVFLTQADTFLSDDEKKDEPKLYFLPVLEPSLLDDTVSSPERFIAVAVAQVNEVLEEKHSYAGSEDGGGSALLDEYGKVYRDVAEAISGVQSFMKRDGSGADDLFSMQSVISLERSLHRFFGVACRMLKVKALILRFDDVDMACGIGFCVLEAIRKYLATPYVVPMVSGDLSLYQRLCENHFREKLKDKEDGDEEDKKAESLTESYLQKVLPADRRVELHALGYGMASREIQIDGVRLVDGIATTEMKWEDAKACLDFYAFGAMKNERYRRDALPDSVEHKECFRGTEKLSIPLELPSTRAAFMFLSRIFDVLKDWKEKGGENSFSWEYFRIFHEAARDVTEHVKAFEARQEAARVNVLASADGRLSVSKIFRNLDLKKLGFEDGMREGAEEKKTLCISKRAISNRSFKEDIVGNLCGSDRFLWNLFVQEDYYSKANTNTNLVFGGRFFEYVFSSFDSNFDFPQLLSKVPFGSALEEALKKKPQDEDSASGKEEDGDDEDDAGLPAMPDGSEREKNVFCYPSGKGLLRIDSYFLGEVSKRYFANLGKARTRLLSHNRKDGESLSTFMRRCAYILLNAVAGVEQEEVKYTPYDIATKRVGTLSDFESFDTAWKKNIALMLKKEDSVTKKIFDHPLVSLLIKNETMMQTTPEEMVKGNKSKLNMRLCVFDEIDINGRLSKAEIDILFDHEAASWDKLNDFELTYAKNRRLKGIKSLSVSLNAKSPSREAFWRQKFRELYAAAQEDEKTAFNDKYPNFIRE